MVVFADYQIFVLGRVSDICHLIHFAASFQPVWDTVIMNISKWQGIKLWYLIKYLQTETI